MASLLLHFPQHSLLAFPACSSPSFPVCASHAGTLSAPSVPFNLSYCVGEQVAVAYLLPCCFRVLKLLSSSPLLHQFMVAPCQPPLLLYGCAGEQIGSSLVEAKLAACVNVVPGITSIYW